MNEAAVIPPADAAPAAVPPAPEPLSAPGRPDALASVADRVRGWLKHLHHEPTEAERAAAAERARLLDELNRAVADAPDDVPLRDVIARANRFGGE